MSATGLRHTRQLTDRYLERVFRKNNYNADFIKRNIYRPTEADATNRNPTPLTTVTIPYIKGHFRDYLTDPTALQHSCSPQTYNYVTTITDKRERQRRT